MPAAAPALTDVVHAGRSAATVNFPTGTQGTGAGGVTDVRQKIARNARLRVLFGGGGTRLGAVSSTVRAR